VYNTAVLYSEIAVKVLKLLYNVGMKEEYLFAELALEWPFLSIKYLVLGLQYAMSDFLLEEQEKVTMLRLLQFVQE